MSCVLSTGAAGSGIGRQETFNTPLGDAAGYFAGATGRSFVLHIADELIHHTAEAALLRDLFAGSRVRA